MDLFERYRDLLREALLASPREEIIMAVTEEHLRDMDMIVNDFRRRLSGMLRCGPNNPRRATFIQLKTARKKEYLIRIKLLKEYFIILSEFDGSEIVEEGRVRRLEKLEDLYVEWTDVKEYLDDILRVRATESLTPAIIYDADVTERLQLILENYEDAGVDAGDVMRLLCQGADPNTANSSGETGILIACMRYHYALIDVFLNFEETDPTIIAEGYLCQKNAIHFGASRLSDVDYSFDELCETVVALDSPVGKLDILDGNGYSALQCADLSLRKTAVLLKCGANPNTPFPRHLNRTRMHCMMRHDYSDRMLQLYIDYKADVNAKDDDRDTPLHFAVIFKKPSAVKILIANHADLFAENRFGQTPLECADANTPMYAEIKAAEDQWRQRWLAVAMINHSGLREPAFYPSFAARRSSLSSTTGGGPPPPPPPPPPPFVLPHDLLRSMSRGLFFN
jgi:ankyrin repeat protein